jgi:hypothetical protein
VTRTIAQSRPERAKSLRLFTNPLKTKLGSRRLCVIEALRAASVWRHTFTGSIRIVSTSVLNGFLNFAASKTPGADSNAFWLTVDQCPDWLEVGLEDSFGLVVGVTDVMAGLATFATEIACKCHWYTPLSGRIESRLWRSESTIGSFIMTSRAMKWTDDRFL